MTLGPLRCDALPAAESRALACAYFCLEGKEAGAGAVDEEDFIKAFEDVPSVQVG